ncbi:c-type cytochrome [Sphingopyxis sp.]|jgi:cytochrome c|uniref:c-type cytochrome n=1 Tax=Sphingopyxis sp. TaxID=1908224 RepID=UPI002DF09561|nr:c-type cytochrome [Sphingopyxis sp.]
MTRFLFSSLAIASALVSAPLVMAGPAAAQADPARGETLFKQRCAMCHTVKGKGGKLGPDLTGVVGRKAGSGSFAYSPAMKSSKLVWKPATIETYLAAPTKLIPGSRMTISVSKPDERKALASYLASVR